MPGPSPRPSPARLHIGDLVGLPAKGGDTKPPDIGVVTSLQAGKAEVRTLHHTKSRQGPARQLELLAPCPDPTQGAAPDPSHHPWQITEEALRMARPRPRDLGATWQLLVEGGDLEPLPLAAFAELAGGSGEPLLCCACWLWLQGDQTLFRLKQGLVEPRPLEELRRIRQDRHRQRLADAREHAWTSALRQRQPIQAESLAPKQADALAQLRAAPLSTNSRELVEQCLAG